MGYSLNELLDATGIDAMSGANMRKTASAKPVRSEVLSKLAERCRQAAETSESAADARALVEKTAAVAIIQRVLQECANIEGQPAEKTAAPVPEVQRAAFIKAALAQGHSPEDVAAFLEKVAFNPIQYTKGLVHAGKRRVAGARYRGARRRMIAAGGDSTARTARLRELAGQVEGMNPKEADKAIKGLIAEFGDDAKAFSILSEALPKSAKRADSFKQLKRWASEEGVGLGGGAGGAAAATGPRAGSFNVMGKEVLSPEAWKKVKKSPYTYAGGGAAAAMALRPGRRDGQSRKGPVTIVQ